MPRACALSHILATFRLTCRCKNNAAGWLSHKDIVIAELVPRARSIYRPSDRAKQLGVVAGMGYRVVVA